MICRSLFVVLIIAGSAAAGAAVWTVGSRHCSIEVPPPDVTETDSDSDPVSPNHQKLLA